MNSQIYDSGLERDAEEILASTDRRMAETDRQRAQVAERRRALAEPTHKVVVANPSGMHHKITLGAMLVNENFQASDADALAGLLSLDAGDFSKRFSGVAEGRPDARTSEVIAHLIDIYTRELAAHGLFLAWQRRLSLFLEDRAEWLALDEEFRLNGAWRDAQMTADQRWLIRVTCRVLNMGIPGHLLRGQAADWLDDHGANLNYGDFM